MHHFLKTLPINILHSFKGKKIFFHLAAIVLTFIILDSGLDWEYFVTVRNLNLDYLFFPAIVIGAIVPIILPITLIIVGKIKNSKKISVSGWCLAQAVILGSIISSMYKAFTGRVQPNLVDLINDVSHSFQFGFWRHGVFWGWPSSHTTIAFSMAFALMGLHVENKKVVFFSLLYIFYIGIGVSFSVHWFSEFVAGAIIGTVIGVTVGKSFVKELK